jgi:hypothetical protein
VTARRFAPPWSVEELDAAFVVKESAEQARSLMFISRMSRDGVRRPSCSRAMRHKGLRPILRSCRSLLQKP